MKLLSRYGWVLALLFGADVVVAQDDSGKKRPAEISLVALGPKPPRKYAANDDGEGPVMLLAKPGETPPPQLFYQGKPKKGEKEWTAMSLPFNNPSVMRSVPPDQAIDLHRKRPGDDNYEPYLTIPAVPPGGRVLFFCQPSQFGPVPWEKPPKVARIDLLSEELKGKQFILYNLSKHMIFHAFEESVVTVDPRQVISYKRPISSQLYRLAAGYGSKKEIIYHTAVRLNHQGNIQLFVFYDANPATNSGREVGVFRTMIPAPLETSEQGRNP